MEYIKRDLENRIRKYIDKDEIIAISGVRQCGKTTLLKKIFSDIVAGGTKAELISFDDVSKLHLFEEDIDSFITLYVKPYQYLFIDEIQYARHSGKRLKYIYDTTATKLFITGSSAAEIAVESLKYLAGRIFSFTLYPFSFKEYILSKNKNLISLYEKGDYSTEMIRQFNKYLHEFLIYGGFPRVVLSKEIEEKKIVLQNIYNVYLLREIKELFDLSDDFKFAKLLKALALQSGNILNYNELCSITGISFPKLKKYLNILEKTYIAGLTLPYFTNKRTELVKSPKIHFFDPGFRNICLNNFSDTIMGTGEIYELFVFSEFRKHSLSPKFWRTKSKAEVDFVIETPAPVPVEVKTTLESTKVSKSMYSFLNKYDVPEAYILSSDFEAAKQVEKSRINFLPFVKSNLMLRKIS